jgi:hypothetical protein
MATIFHPYYPRRRIIVIYYQKRIQLAINILIELVSGPDCPRRH